MIEGGVPRESPAGSITVTSPSQMPLERLIGCIIRSGDQSIRTNLFAKVSSDRCPTLNPFLLRRRKNDQDKC
ncbi:hypothetical protein LCGC14_0998590 [marine sediment metagenome]|uniref:Uncharacterized protein n=1 Tax=marine sediment metagenome TaxID=412755 RepID=A0A0F9R9V6_9ZZZZ